MAAEELLPKPGDSPAGAGDVAAAAPAASRAARRHYFWNAVLLLACVLSYWIWYLRHETEHLAEVKMFGGVVGALALWKLIESWIETAFDKDRDALLRGFLGRRSSRE